MLTSIALILICGMLLGWLCKKIRFPALFGMLVTGILLGPYVFDLIDDSILNISADIRRMALIIILIRAGLSLKIEDLKKVGRPAILMCFVPACFEIVGMLLLAPRLLGLSILDAAILGSVVAAVSPAVVVPKMVKLMDEGYGMDKGIPSLILAGASVDDIFVIVLFATFTGMAKGSGVSVRSFVNIPASIILGAVVGFVIGIVLDLYFKKIHIRDTVKVAVMLSVAFLFVTLEDELAGYVPFAALIAVMFMGIALRGKRENVANRLSAKFNKLWVVAEVMLFVLVGASVNIESAKNAGVSVLILLAGVLIFRMLGVFVCLLGTKFNMKERVFCMVAYTPKATVQAAIGGIPLSMGLAYGDTVLTVSVIAIMVTAPLGAFAIDLLYRRNLQKEEQHE